jgi:ABC-2 type transport system ATP-binding protein
MINLAIEVNNLTKYYGPNLVLNNLSLKVPKNTVYGLLGINGAGKTTTFGILSGFIKKYQGEYKINGKLSVLPQDARLYTGRSIKSQLQFFAKLGGSNPNKIEEEVINVLKKVGLENKINSKPEKLSHGMNKRLLVAQALLSEPEIIFLDEPLSGLDPKNSYEMKKVIADLKKDKTVIISSHILADIEELCEYVGIIHNGKCRHEGKLVDIQNENSTILFKVNKSLDKNIFAAIKEIKSIAINNQTEVSIDFDLSKISLEALNAKVLEILNNNKIGIREIKPAKSFEKSFLDLLK